MQRLMEAALQNIVQVYLKSSKGKEYLGRKEFQTLVSSQFSNVLTVRKTLTSYCITAHCDL